MTAAAPSDSACRIAPVTKSAITSSTTPLVGTRTTSGPIDDVAPEDGRELEAGWTMSVPLPLVRAWPTRRRNDPATARVTPNRAKANSARPKPPKPPIVARKRPGLLRARSSCTAHGSWATASGKAGSREFLAKVARRWSISRSSPSSTSGSFIGCSLPPTRSGGAAPAGPRSVSI